MNSWYHSKASAKKWGGAPEEYAEIHDFIDSSKRIVGDVRHRSIYHHTEGIWLCQRIFGRTITVGDPPREVPVRLIAELHVMQDLGWIPSPSDYIQNMELKQWMGGPVRREQNLDDFLPARPQPKETYYDKKPKGTGALDTWNF